MQALFSDYPYPWPPGTSAGTLGSSGQVQGPKGSQTQVAVREGEDDGISVHSEDVEHSTSSDSSSVQDEDGAGPVLPTRFPTRKAYRCGSAKGLDVDSDDWVALAVLEATSLPPPATTPTVSGAAGGRRGPKQGVQIHIRSL